MGGKILEIFSFFTYNTFSKWYALICITQKKKTVFLHLLCAILYLPSDYNYVKNIM